MTAGNTENTDNSAPRVRQREDWPAIGLDILLLVVFAWIGRNNHDASLTPGEIAWTALPFAAGALITHLVLFYRGANVRSLPSGLIIFLGTWVLGVILRWITGGGIPWDFILVAGAFLALFLLGWRVILWIILRLRANASR